MKNIHDNIILKYIIDFEENKITFYTKTEEGEKVNIVFEDMLVYFFEEQVKENIIFDIEESEYEEFISDKSEMLKEKKDFGWPIVYENIEKLNMFMKKNTYKYYTLISSIGMNGWVVAKKMKII